ncbi:MAG: hypothetical protein AB9873_11505 [Syntrophobacteraceae bacterium]
MHGRRMSEQEYAERLSGLLERVKAGSAPGESDAVLFERYRDAEFDLTVEYRLGPDFPDARREPLRVILKRVREQTEGLKQEYLAGRLTGQEFAERMQAATDSMAEACGSVLTPEEMRDYFGQEEGALKLPFLPGAWE